MMERVLRWVMTVLNPHDYLNCIEFYYYENHMDLYQSFIIIILLLHDTYHVEVFLVSVIHENEATTNSWVIYLKY